MPPKKARASKALVIGPDGTTIIKAITVPPKPPKTRRKFVERIKTEDIVTTVVINVAGVT